MKFYISAAIVTALVVCSLAVSMISSPTPKHLETQVVKVVSMDGCCMGTGFFIETSRNTYIMTNSHVCDLSLPLDTMQIFSPEEQQSVSHVVRFDPAIDLCILTTKHTRGLHLAKFVPFETDAFTFGYPLGRYRTYSKAKTFGDLFMTQVYPGQSGSPVFDNFGNVIGIIQVSFGAGFGGFIPASTIEIFMGDL
jgi:S1-C subfamily serine protease